VPLAPLIDAHREQEQCPDAQQQRKSPFQEHESTEWLGQRSQARNGVQAGWQPLSPTFQSGLTTTRVRAAGPARKPIIDESMDGPRITLQPPAAPQRRRLADLVLGPPELPRRSGSHLRAAPVAALWMARVVRTGNLPEYGFSGSCPCSRQQAMCSSTDAWNSGRDAVSYRRRRHPHTATAAVWG
jgi:hypothetical protein